MIRKHGGSIFVILITLLVTSFGFAAITQSNKIAERYKVITDSGKIYKCDSVMWKSYDTVIPTPKTTIDTVHRIKRDTLKHK